MCVSKAQAFHFFRMGRESLAPKGPAIRNAANSSLASGDLSRKEMCKPLLSCKTRPLACSNKYYAVDHFGELSYRWLPLKAKAVRLKCSSTQHCPLAKILNA
jgi:hypothetical protein